MIDVKLTLADELLAARVGLERTEYSKRNGHVHSFTVTNAGNYFSDIMAASGAVAGEIAVAKSLGINDFIPTSNTFKSTADIGENIEVKWTAWTGGHLVIHPKDRDTDVAILVVGQSPNLRVIGWLPVMMAKRPKYRHTKDHAWWVSQINLQPIENLLRSNYAHPSI
jgi:hypothetical protein